uniref:Carboxypeptidase-like regulatory domain-containing protein n=1 Tax=Roseihalotalea indica TaxID=2867963 RepID=A0AA49PZQ1_9BACT|nr:carboxypeptidase-like regulatory domain-containing protein [Tunicatimonas sp. TK19036]
MRVYILLFGLFLYSGSLIGQYNSADTTIQLSGNIVDDQDQPLSFATVTNLTTQTGVISNEEGFFYLTFQRKDTIRISSVGYEPAVLYFGDTAQATNYDLQIRMSDKTYELENVTVFAFKDEESFKRAVLDLKDIPDESPKIVIPGSYDGPRREPKSTPLNPVSYVFDRFSRRAKYERQARQAQQNYEHRKQLARKYNRDMVGEITGLTEGALDDFMIFCRFEEDFIERSSQYDLILAINQCYTDFSEQNKQ